MAVMNSALQPPVPNRRRRVRHKIQTPAYATFTPDSPGAMLDLHEIVDISEDGIAIQCHTPLETERSLKLCLDLADCPQHIYTAGHVVWSSSSGRAGVRFSELEPESLARLREWLFINVMAGVANGETDLTFRESRKDIPAPRPSFSDTLAAVTAVERQAESFGSNLDAALQMIADRSRDLVRASGVAIALADFDPDSMACRASSGPGAPPAGVRLHVGSGFSGECVKTGILLRCDDSELDARVDRESCLALGIRSILAVPLRAEQKSIGILEAFSSQPHAFGDADSRLLQRLGDLVLAAVNRAPYREIAPAPPQPKTESAPGKPSLAERESKPLSFPATPGSVLFASVPEETTEPEKKENETKESKGSNAISLPRSSLLILVGFLSALAMVLGYTLAPSIQSKLRHRGPGDAQTVLASTKPGSAFSTRPTIEGAPLEQVQEMANQGDPAAENSLGLRYATGDGVPLNEQQAVRWFTKAAEQGNVPSQSKLGSIYFSGRGVPQDPNRAYFWMVVARLSGDDASKTLAPFVRARLTRAQVTSIELDADRWLQQHPTKSKPAPGLLSRSR